MYRKMCNKTFPWMDQLKNTHQGCKIKLTFGQKPAAKQGGGRCINTLREIYDFLLRTNL